MSPLSPVAERLRHWLLRVETEFLERQTPPFMLLPAGTANTVHGDYAHAWVRDNVYSILAAFALSQAFLRQEGDGPEHQKLVAAVSGLMRGLLAAMGKQSKKIEAFKQTENPLDALHAKYDALTGDTVVEDDEWGHLQLDATALFLLQLAQMTRAGVKVVRTREEACLVQNLIYYIGPAYRAADFGIWERGKKTNTGVREINASSVGMAKAALEAVTGLTLTLGDGGSFTLHAPADEIVRCRETLAALLPAESVSKETDAALLSVIGFPAYAVEDRMLAQKTKARVLGRLEGRFGCKRFQRDGHQTTREDTSRLHYETGELAEFQNIEAEWPLFWCYLAIDAALQDDVEAARGYLEKLESVAIEREGKKFLPELYFVPDDLASAERLQPGSQTRVPNENIPLYWAQSLWVVASLLSEGLVTADDLDPLRRRDRLGAQVGEDVDVIFVGAAISKRFADSSFAGSVIADVGEDGGVQLTPARALASAFSTFGACASLGLTGRPERRLGAVITSFLYEQSGRTILFTPSSLDSSRSYMRFDAAAFADRIKADIAYVGRHWTATARPLIAAYVPDDVLDGDGAEAIDALVQACASGRVGATRVRLVDRSAALDRPRRSLADFQPIRSALKSSANDSLVVPIWHESADGWFVPVTGSTREERLQRLADSTDPDEMIALILASIETSDFDAPVAGRGRVRDVAHGLYDAAGRRQAWQIVRRVAGLLDLVDERLTDMHKELVVRLRRIAIKAPGQADAFSESPEPGAALRKRLSSAACNDRLKTVLAEETLIHLGAEIKANPTTFSGCRTVRIWEWIALLEQEPAILARGQNLADCAPHFISQAVRDVLNGSVAVRTLLASGEAHHVANQGPTDWRLWRSRLGVLTRVGDDFFDRVWRLLGRCDGLVVGEAHAPGARIDSRIIRSDHTPHERGFALLLEDALSRIASGPYRTLTLEAINAAASACEIDAGFSTLGDLSLDAIIHDALRKADGEGEEALRSFVARSPWDVAARLGQSLRALYGA